MRVQETASLVTAAGRGTGRAVAEALAPEGAAIVLAVRTASGRPEPRPPAHGAAVAEATVGAPPLGRGGSAFSFGRVEPVAVRRRAMDLEPVRRARCFDGRTRGGR